VVVALLIDAVINKLPVLTVTAEPVFTVKLNVLPSPFVNVSVFELTLPVVIRLPVLVPAAFKANDAVVANDAEIEVSANEAEVATDALLADKSLIALEAVTFKLVMFEPVPSVRILPEICTRSS
jgi:hypothetical protein